MQIFINTVEKSRTARSDKNTTLTAALKRVIKQLLGTYSITQVKHYKRENEKNQSIFSMLFLFIGSINKHSILAFAVDEPKYYENRRETGQRRWWDGPP